MKWENIYKNTIALKGWKFYHIIDYENISGKLYDGSINWNESNHQQVKSLKKQKKYWKNILEKWWWDKKLDGIKNIGLLWFRVSWEICFIFSFFVLKNKQFTSKPSGLQRLIIIENKIYIPATVKLMVIKQYKLNFQP